MAGTSQEEQDGWLLRVHALHSGVTPEEHMARHQRLEESRLAQVSAQRCNAVRGHAARSHALLGATMGQMASFSAPGNFAAMMPAWQAAQSHSENQQRQELAALAAAGATAQVGGVAQSSEAPAMGMPNPAGSALYQPGLVIFDPMRPIGGPALAPVVEGVKRLWSSIAWPFARDPEAKRVRGESFEKLLEQFRTEPEGEEERVAKFELFEGYVSEVGKMLSNCTELVQELPGDMAEDMKAQLKKAVECREALAVPHKFRGWIVYPMMIQAEKNNHAMEAILGCFQVKFEKISKLNQAECPVCFEPFTDEGPQRAVTLGCCHKVCQDCWGHWSAMQGSAACCPCCRHNEFRSNVADRASQLPQPQTPQLPDLLGPIRPPAILFDRGAPTFLGPADLLGRQPFNGSPFLL